MIHATSRCEYGKTQIDKLHQFALLSLVQTCPKPNFATRKVGRYEDVHSVFLYRIAHHSHVKRPAYHNVCDSMFVTRLGKTRRGKRMLEALIAIAALERKLVFDMLAEESTGAGKAKVALPDGPGEYELAGFVSHMGASTAAGQFVLVLFVVLVLWILCVGLSVLVHTLHCASGSALDGLSRFVGEMCGGS